MSVLELFGDHVHVQPKDVVEGHLVTVPAEDDKRLSEN